MRSSRGIRNPLLSHDLFAALYHELSAARGPRPIPPVLARTSNLTNDVPRKDQFGTLDASDWAPFRPSMQAALNRNIHTHRGAPAYDRVQATSPASRLYSPPSQLPYNQHLLDHTTLLYSPYQPPTPNTRENRWKVLKRVKEVRVSPHLCK